jgi:exonuclease SbcD
MKFLHTADWHLGRSFHGLSLLDDQAHVLDQFVELAITERVDAVLIAGDVYDRAVPPADAVALLDDVLSRLVVDAGIPVIVIAGNHDSAERIGFGGRILAPHKLTLRGRLDQLQPVLLRDAHGEVAFHPLPYVEPAMARALPGAAQVSGHQDAMDHMVALIRANQRAGQRNVLVGHAFVAGCSESESERPLSVGGSGMVGVDSFGGFDYVALGHLHRPQALGAAQRVRYAGSLLKYSFSEVDHAKSVALVELGPAGEVAVTPVALTPRRDVRIVTGTLNELLTHPDAGASRDDYLCAQLTDNTPQLEPMARLREVYPHMLELRFTASTIGAGAGRTPGDHRTRQPDDLFRAFYRDMLDVDIDAAALDIFNTTANCVIRADGASS